jgi:hypothetical protein
MFVSEDVLKKEKDHIEGFATEVAWVTHAYVICCLMLCAAVYMTPNVPPEEITNLKGRLPYVRLQRR